MPECCQALPTLKASTCPSAYLSVSRDGFTSQSQCILLQLYVHYCNITLPLAWVPALPAVCSLGQYVPCADICNSLNLLTPRHLWQSPPCSDGTSGLVSHLTGHWCVGQPWIQATNRIVIRILIKLILLSNLMSCCPCHCFHFCKVDIKKQSRLTSFISFSISSSLIAIISLETTSSPLRLCSSCKGKMQIEMVTLPLKVKHCLETFIWSLL